MLTSLIIVDQYKQFAAKKNGLNWLGSENWPLTGSLTPKVQEPTSSGAGGRSSANAKDRCIWCSSEVNLKAVQIQKQ